MRWLMILLLSANLAYYVGSRSQAAAPVLDSGISMPALGLDHPDIRSVSLLDAALIRPSEQSLLSEGAALPLWSEKVQLSGAQCWLIGPLPEQVTAKQIQSRFSSGGMASKILSRPLRGDPGFAVYLQGGGGIDRAREQMRLLQLAGYAGAQLRQSSASYRVRIGHYPRRELAEEIKIALSTDGFSAVLQEQFSEINQLMLRVVLGPAQDISEGFWRGLERDFPRYPREQNWCGAIASVG